MSAETHLWGSFDGYRTLKSSSGVRFDESEQLSEFGFGQTSDESILGRFEECPCVLGRGLRSGRIAVSRAFRGLPDDAGRPTIELRTLVFDIDEFHRVRGALPSIVRDTKTWSRAAFAEGRTVSVPSATVGSLTPDAWKVIDSWIELRGRQDVLFQLASGKRSEEAILATVGGVRNGDVQALRWGLNLLSTTAAADVCTLVSSANISTRRSVVRLDLDGGWRSQRIAELSRSNGPPPSMADMLQPLHKIKSSGEIKFKGGDLPRYPSDSVYRPVRRTDTRSQARSRRWLLVTGGVASLFLLGTLGLVNDWFEWGDRRGSADEHNDLRVVSIDSEEEPGPHATDRDESRPPEESVVDEVGRGAIANGPPDSDDAASEGGDRNEGAADPPASSGGAEVDVELPSPRQTDYDDLKPQPQPDQESEEAPADPEEGDVDEPSQGDGSSPDTEERPSAASGGDGRGSNEGDSPCSLQYGDLLPILEGDLDAIFKWLTDDSNELSNKLSELKRKKDQMKNPGLKAEATRQLELALKNFLEAGRSSIGPFKVSCEEYQLGRRLGRCWFSAAEVGSDSGAELDWLTKARDRSSGFDGIDSHEAAKNCFSVNDFPDGINGLDRVVDRLETLRDSLHEIGKIYNLIEKARRHEKEAIEWHLNNLSPNQKQLVGFPWDDYTEQWMIHLVEWKKASACLGDVFDDAWRDRLPPKNPLVKYLLSEGGNRPSSVTDVVERLHQILKQVLADARTDSKGGASGGMLGNPSE